MAPVASTLTCGGLWAIWQRMGRRIRSAAALVAIAHPRCWLAPSLALGESGKRAEARAEPAKTAAEGNLDAERALVRVAAKLDGYEGAELRSVAGQVQQLLQDAQDPDLLCALYPGWAPWV